MVLASSQATRSPEPVSRPSEGKWGWLAGVAAMFAITLALSRGDLQWSHTALAIAGVVGAVLLCALWFLHLESVEKGWSWLSLLPPLLAAQLALVVLRTRPSSTGEWIGATGGGVFVYLVLWIFATYEHEKGLQPLATGALLVSVGVLAKPVVAISCILLSLVFFLLCRRRDAAGTVGFALLLFTPAVLCAISLALLSTVAGSALGSFSGGLSVFPICAAHPARGADPALTACLRSGLALSLAAAVTRLLERTAGVLDIAYGALLLFLAIAGAARWMPVPLNTADVAMITYGGGTCLMALAPPHSWSGRLLVFVGAGAPLLFLLPWRS
jgi:hypothetical protein